MHLGATRAARRPVGTASRGASRMRGGVVSGAVRGVRDGVVSGVVSGSVKHTCAERAAPSRRDSWCACRSDSGTPARCASRRGSASC